MELGLDIVEIGRIKSLARRERLLGERVRFLGPSAVDREGRQRGELEDPGAEVRARLKMAKIFIG